MDTVPSCSCRPRGGAVGRQARIEDSTTHETDDGGRRWERFWEWVLEDCAGALWHLRLRRGRTQLLEGHGIRSALVEFA